MLDNLVLSDIYKLFISNIKNYLIILKKIYNQFEKLYIINNIKYIY